MCVCVLLCFVDPILGNRYGPGVNSFRQCQNANLSRQLFVCGRIFPPLSRSRYRVSTFPGSALSLHRSRGRGFESSCCFLFCILSFGFCLWIHPTTSQFLGFVEELRCVGNSTVRERVEIGRHTHTHTNWQAHIYTLWQANLPQFC